MGREIRRVPPNWEHPVKWNGEFRPLFDTYYAEAAEEWVRCFNKFQEEKKSNNAPGVDYYWEYDRPPEEEMCLPYSQEEATWFQVYETVSEGTPVTPPFETQEELIEHLIEFGESLTGKYNPGGFSREAAENFVMVRQWAPSMVVSAGGISSGIECCAI